MSWGSFTHSARKLLSNPKNILATVGIPFTAGASMALYEDNSGRSMLDGLRGTTDVERQNNFNAQQAQLTRDWQENLANTAIQRSTADAMEAGYNPVLGATNPAATPNGATASSVGLPQSPMSALTEAVSAGSNLMNTVADVNLKSTQAGLNKAEKENIETQTRWMPRLNQAKIELDNATTGLQRQQILESQAKTMALDFENKMKGMDVEKRSSQFWKELEIYKNELTQAMINSGYDSTTTGAVINKITDYASKFFNIGINFNHTTSKSNVTSTSNNTSTIKHTI